MEDNIFGYEDFSNLIYTRVTFVCLGDSQVDTLGAPEFHRVLIIGP